jgi:hypothetical protein
MKVGDLVRLKNSATGDNSEMVKLWRERTPCLVTNIISSIGWAHVLDAGAKRVIRVDRLEVIET